MRGKRGVVAGVLVLLIAAGAALWFGRGGGGKPDAGGGGSAAPSDADVLAKRRAARAARAGARTPAAVSGTVLDAQSGAPLAGAVVLLSPQSFLGPRDDESGVQAAPLTATSDGSGAWSIAAVPPGRWRAGASARGYQAGGKLDLVVVAGQPLGGVELRLAPGGRALVGKVTDVGGGPVAGAVVSAQTLTGASLLGTTAVPAATLSGEDGGYRLDLAEGLYLVHAEHADYVPIYEDATVRGPETVLDLVMTPGGSVSGVVRARADQRPVPGALVLAKGGRSLAEDEGGFAELGALIGAGGVLTDEAGRFTLRGLGSGAVELVAVAPRFHTREPVVVELGIAETRGDVEILVDGAFSISGFVVRRGHEDEGVPGVLVGGVQLKNDIQPTIFDETDELGYFELPGVAPGKYGLVAAKDGLLPNLLRTTVTVSDHDEADVLLVVDVGATLRGRVEPPGPATLSLQMKEADFSFTMIPSMAAAVLVHGRAGPDGSFELRGVPPGSFYLAARTDDGRAGELAVQVGADDQDGLVVKLERRAAIAGRVVDDGGQPLGGVEVDMWAQGKRDERIDFGEIGKGEVRTAPDGTFEALGLDPGTYSLHVSDAEGGIDWADGFQAPSVTIKQGERRDGVELRVKGRRGVIRGRVVDAQGAPVADAWVGARRGTNLYGIELGEDGGEGERIERKPEGPPPSDEDAPEAGWGGRDRAALTGADGRFELRGLRSEPYDLSAEHGGARGHKRGVKPDADVTLRLRPLGGVAGKVTIGGAPVVDYRLSVEGPVRREQRVMDEGGEYAMSRLDAGEYKLRITSDVGAATATATVKAGEVAEVDVALEPWGEVSGRIVDAITGKPLSGLNVMASSLEVGDPGEQALGMFTGEGPKTDAEGRFRVGKLGPGKGYVVAFSGLLSGFEPVMQSSFELAPGEKKDLGDLKGLTQKKVDEAERGSFGFAATDMDGTGRTLKIYQVDAEGPAAAAGVKNGDLVTSVDGRAVSALSPEVARELLSPMRVKVGQTVVLGLERDGKALPEVTLVAVPLPATTTP